MCLPLASYDCGHISNPSMTQYLHPSSEVHCVSLMALLQRRLEGSDPSRHNTVSMGMDKQLFSTRNGEICWSLLSRNESLSCLPYRSAHLQSGIPWSSALFSLTSISITKLFSWGQPSLLPSRVTSGLDNSLC